MKMVIDHLEIIAIKCLKVKITESENYQERKVKVLCEREIGGNRG
jgi:hypothetical protein